MESNANGRTPLLHFAACSGLMIVVFFGISVTDAYQNHVGRPYTEWTADASGVLLELIGVDAVAVDGDAVFAGGAVVQIDRGCDASTPCALLASLILCFPAGGLRRLAAVCIGVAVLIGVNLVRVATLALAAAHSPGIFDFLHVDFWQVAMIVLAIGLSATWFRLATGAARTKVTTG